MTRTKPRPPRISTRPTPKWAPAAIAVGVTAVVVAAGWVWSVQDQARREREIRARIDAIVEEGRQYEATLPLEQRAEIERIANRSR